MGNNAEKTIGIIAAMEFEVQILKKALQNPEAEIIAGIEYFSGTIGNHKVVVTECGVGKVSAALGAQAMILQYHPNVIINTGCAGAISKNLKVGDLVLADTTVEWDLDTTVIGNPRGYVYALGRVEMHTDCSLTDEFAEILQKDSKIYRGMVVSGDQFVSLSAQRALILESFPDALCAEMEGGAIGHVCEQNGVPFCVIRSISDNANSDSGVDFAAFSKAAGEQSAAFLLKYLNGFS